MWMRGKRLTDQERAQIRHLAFVEKKSQRAIAKIMGTISKSSIQREIVSGKKSEKIATVEPVTMTSQHPESRQNEPANRFKTTAEELLSGRFQDTRLESADRPNTPESASFMPATQPKYHWSRSDSCDLLQALKERGLRPSYSIAVEFLRDTPRVTDLTVLRERLRLEYGIRDGDAVLMDFMWKGPPI